MTPLTAEDAYWHACSGTPIDADSWTDGPAIVGHRRYAHEMVHRVYFADSSVETVRCDLVACYPSRAAQADAINRIARRQYLERRR